MKRALVLAGGGTRGAYQYGSVLAMQEIGNYDFNIITGTSIGGLNGVLLVQKDFEAMATLWENLTSEQIIQGGLPSQFDLPTLISEKNRLADFFKTYLREKGVDNSPFIDTVHRLYNQERFQASDIDYGCVTVKSLSLDPVYVNREMMLEHGADWLISTASCFPAFPIHHFSEGGFIDGGYFDNCPIDYAVAKGADEVVVVDLNNEPKHKEYIDWPHFTYIFPKFDTGSFLEFDNETRMKLKTCGYNDTMKIFHKYVGVKYTFKSFQQPSYFDQYYMNCVRMDREISLEMSLADGLRGDSYIGDKLLAQQYRKVLSVNDFYMGMLDNLMDLIGTYDIRTVYDYTDVCRSIAETFQQATIKNVNTVSLKNLANIPDYIKTLGKISFITQLVHQNLFSDQIIFPRSVILKLFPFEQALANLVTIIIQKEIH